MQESGSSKTCRIGIIAGELSGDFAGCNAWYAANELAVMGLSEVLKDLPRLLKIKKDVLNRWLLNPPDLFIGIDAPDFNLRVAKKLKAAGIKTAHYVSPSVWAWREGRVKSIAKAVDELFCLLPFEPMYYQKTSVQAHFVGHPMADNINPRVLFSDATDIPNENPHIAILPGSRQGELKYLAKPFIQTITLLVLNQYAAGIQVNLSSGTVDALLSEADIALIASGTATLQAMLHTCPMVVAYKMSPITIGLLRLFKAFKAKHFSLPNILADKELVPELLQKDVTPKNLSQRIIDLLDNKQKIRSMQENFLNLHQVLQQNTNTKVADIILQNSIVAFVK